MRTLALSVLLAATAAAADEVRYLSADDATGGSVAVVVRDVPLVHTAQFTDPAAGGTKRTAAEQADGALRAMLAAVKAGGGDPDRVIRLNVGVATADAAGPVREAIARRFEAGRRPAVTLVVGKLPAPDAVVAMDAVAAAAGRLDRVKRVGDVKGLSPVGGAAAAILPAGRRVYVSGQAEKGDTAADAARKTLEGLRTTLTWLGLTDADVVQCRAFLTPVSATPEVVKVFAAHFGPNGPPLAVVEWESALPIEIELVAAAPGPPTAEEPVDYLTPPGMTASPIYARVTRVASDRFIYTGGLVSGKRGSGADQVTGVFDRLSAVLKEAGSDFGHLAKATYFVADEDASRELNRLRPRYYDPKRPPAASKAKVAGVGVRDRSLVLDMIAIPAAGPVERVRYLRPSGTEFVPECEFTLRKTGGGSSVDSMTGRGKARLTVAAHYDERDRLTEAGATLVRDDRSISVTVSASDGKASVRRADHKAQEFEVPPGVIVTSAPDWTDTFLLCRRYDRKAGGRQVFPGLWIHPEQAGQRLTFAIERTGEDTIEHGGQKVVLGRYAILLRGDSRYAAWADETGKMIKLVPLPHKAGAASGIVLDGYEKSTAGLSPQASPPYRRE